MMMKRRNKKLVIAKETLLNLKNEPVYGLGGTFYECSFLCPTSVGGICAQEC
jgi:hypothetical protein